MHQEVAASAVEGQGKLMVSRLEDLGRLETATLGRSSPASAKKHCPEDRRERGPSEKKQGGGCPDRVHCQKCLWICGDRMHQRI